MKIVTLGEIMLRLSPAGAERIVQADSFCVQYGGAEANVAVALAGWGAEAFFASKVPYGEIGQSAVNALKRYDVDTKFVLRGGERLGLYYLEQGAGQRPSKVIYDRKGSAFACSAAEEYDFDALFAGADWFHLTGITPALGENVQKIAESACRAAKRAGAKISFDLNYRSSLWSKEDAKRAFDVLLGYTDVCITNESQMRDFYGIMPAAREEGCGYAARFLKEKFGVGYTAFTYRKTVGTGETVCGALSDGTASYMSDEFAVAGVERIGSGDAFAAGLIYSLCVGEPLRAAVRFAAAASCLKNTVRGDFCLLDKEEIAEFAQGKKYFGVKR